jgi:tetratricopeptide (TPR) repeat protein
MNHALALTKQGMILAEDNAVNMDRPEEAVAALERAFNMMDALVHQDGNDQSTRSRMAMAGNAMADILRHSDPQRALAIYDHTLRHMAEIQNHSGARRREVNALVGSSYALRSLGRNPEAAQRLDAAFERLRAIKDYPAEKIKPGTEAAAVLFAHADLEASRGNLDKAIAIDRDLLARLLAWGATPESNLPDAVEISRAYQSLADFHMRTGERQRGSDFATRRLALWRSWDARLQHNAFVRRQLAAASGFDAVAGGS